MPILMRKLITYSSEPLLLWTALLLTLSLMQALIGRHTDEAGKFFLAAIVVTGIHFWLERKRAIRDNLKSLCVPMIFPAIVVIYAVTNMPREASPGDYKEIEIGLEYAKTEENRKVILSSIMSAMKDGKISKWESAGLRNLIFERNKFLMRADEADSTEEARMQLEKTIKEQLAKV